MGTTSPPATVLRERGESSKVSRRAEVALGSAALADLV
jgi:hypothetical protein